MDIFQLFQAKLKALREQGMTNRALAIKAQCSHQQINRMLNQPSSYFETVGLKTLVLLFPDIFSKILKDDSTITQSNNTSAAASINGPAVVNHSPTPDYTAILAAVINCDICPECALKVQKAILASGK